METDPVPGGKDTARVEAFSDGVFSIAVTLLVLEVNVPHLSQQAPASELWRELAKGWPSYVALVSSFFTVLIMWTNHHGIFKLIRGTNNRFLFANGFLLLMVSLVPFPTALIAEYIRAESASAVCVVYSGLFVFIALAYGLLWETALRTNLVDPATPSRVIKGISQNGIIGLSLYTLATGAAFIYPLLSVGICTTLWMYWGYTLRST